MRWLSLRSRSAITSTYPWTYKASSSGEWRLCSSYPTESPLSRCRTSGSSFTAPSVVTSIPAAATTTVRISGTPLESGELEIRGCRIRPTNCPVREVEVPIKSAADEGSQARRNLHARYDRPKILGITHQEPRHEREPPSRQRRFLKTTVINSLPLLKVRSTMPDHSSMLLYEGEK